MRLRGGSVTFADAVAERIELRLGPEGTVHAGTVAVRGPLSTFLAMAREAHLDEAQARALEFVAAWFGSPFDAASAHEHQEHPLTWGFWRLSGLALLRCLAAWKGRDPESFGALLGRHGFDILAGLEDEAASPPSLSIVDPASGARVTGRAAELVVASEPRLLAVLARAGRHPAAQVAQIETVVTDAILPALRIKLPGSDKTPEVGVLLRSPAALAIFFYVELAFGLRGVRLFVQATGSDPTEWSKESWIERAGARLERSGRAEHAHALRRIASSPELR